MTTHHRHLGSLRRGRSTRRCCGPRWSSRRRARRSCARTLHGIPLYDGDVEAAEGIPAAVAALKEEIVAADGLLLVTPEYNNGIPGVFKNAIDWLSRPAADIGRVFGGRPVAVIGASPGQFGTMLVAGGLAAGAAHARHRSRGGAGGCSWRGRGRCSTRTADWWTRRRGGGCGSSWRGSRPSRRGRGEGCEFAGVSRVNGDLFDAHFMHKACTRHARALCGRAKY